MLKFKVFICFLEHVFQVLAVGNKMVAFCVLHRGVFRLYRWSFEMLGKIGCT